MAKNELDVIDVGALILVPFMGAIALGTIALQVNVFGSFSFSDVLYSGSGVELTIAALIAILGVGWILATNELDGGDYEWYELAIVAVTLGIVPAFVLIPFVRDFASIDAVSFILALVQSGGAVFISYVE